MSFAWQVGSALRVQRKEAWPPGGWTRHSYYFHFWRRRAGFGL